MQPGKMNLLYGILALALLFNSNSILNANSIHTQKTGGEMTHLEQTKTRLEKHVETLTKTIGDRSVYTPENHEKAAAYIESFYKGIDVNVKRESYTFNDRNVSNIVAEIALGQNTSKLYIVGAHYDSVVGTVGADDNASAVAVQLELARELALIRDKTDQDIAVRFVSFALEEPPVYGTRAMGSRVHAKKAKKDKLAIDGMICLEMVGYTCEKPGCQDYPFPLNFRDYPDTGNFIGLVGNFKSRTFTGELYNAFKKNKDLPAIKLTIPFSGYLLPNVRLSDHASFWDQGYKAVMVTDTAFYRNPHYHLPSDTMEKLDFDFMAQLVKSLRLFFGAVPGMTK